jgi:hypothetical protein
MRSLKVAKSFYREVGGDYMDYRFAGNSRYT